MASISSLGIGSGLDVTSIVSKLVAVEQKPLTTLQTKVKSVETKVSAYAELKSLASTLADASSKLNSLTTWNAVTASSSNSSAVSATAIGGTAATSLSVEVQSVAKAQTSTSALMTTGAAVGAGTLTLTQGVWTPPSGSTAASFAAGTVTPVSVTVSATDTLTDVASKINSAGAGVVASIITDASGQRLMLRSSSTGASNGFQLSVSDNDGNNADASGLSALTVGSSTTYAEDAKATVNGVAVTSSSNTFANVVSGISLTVSAVTTSAATVSVARDTSAIKSAADSFVKAYNALNEALNDYTKYDASTGEAALLQGDSMAVGLQTAMRSVLAAGTVGSSFSRLADVGITQERGGNLTLDSTKFESLLSTNFSDVKSLFKADNGTGATTNGVALKMKTFTQGLLTSDGYFARKEAANQRTLDQYDKEETRLNDKIARVKAALESKYSALDAKMSSLTALNNYVTQQITTWNNSSDS